MNKVYEKYELAITGETAGQRLDHFLVQAVPIYSRTRLQDLINQGHVTLDQTPVLDTAYKVKAGQQYSLIIPQPQESYIIAQPLPLDILYEDSDILILNKAAGMVVHPAPGHKQETMVNALLSHCGDSLSGVGGIKRPGIVHRLDKDTSGLMVVAKNDQAHQGLAAQFASRTLSRRYWALVWGLLPQRSGSIEGAIGRSPRNRQKMALVQRGGKPAQTFYTLQKTFIPANAPQHAITLIECVLATGRTHQIRVHLSAIGHPLVGDPVYGRKSKTKLWPETITQFPRQALHAFQLQLQHPGTQEIMTFNAPLPPDLQNLVEQLQHYCYEDIQAS
jgi:23S rRNA pseudouridine1911/1915/1917 synthase